jgi:pimeloyl-ACP methyl ester carboxylesterase
MKQFHGVNKEVLLNTSFDMDRLVVFLPGISGGAHGARFLNVEALADEDGYACARIDLWEGEESLVNKSYEDIFAQLDEFFAEFKKMDFIDVLLIGKSFGGGVALGYEHELISRKVLWAPAIGVGEGAGNWEEIKGKKFGEIDNLLDVEVGAARIASQSAPIGVIHGTADIVIPLSNSAAIIAAATKGTLKTIAGADHSFKNHEHEVELMALTHELLK